MLTSLIYGVKRNNGEYRTLNKCNFTRKKYIDISFYKSHFRRKDLRNKTMYKNPPSFKNAGSCKRVIPIYLRCNVKCDLKGEASVLDVIKRALLWDKNTFSGILLTCKLQYNI